MRSRLVNVGVRSAVCTFFTLGENKPDEVCYFPNSGKVRIRATGDVLKIVTTSTRRTE